MESQENCQCTPLQVCRAADHDLARAWKWITPDTGYRLDSLHKRVYRRDQGPCEVFGPHIRYVGLDTALGREWFANGRLDEPIATCTPDLASFIDPVGALRRAGLLYVVQS